MLSPGCSKRGESRLEPFIVDVFPDTRLFMTHRTPHQTVPSLFRAQSLSNSCVRRVGETASYKSRDTLTALDRDNGYDTAEELERWLLQRTEPLR